MYSIITVPEIITQVGKVEAQNQVLRTKSDFVLGIKFLTKIVFFFPKLLSVWFYCNFLKDPAVEIQSILVLQCLSNTSREFTLMGPNPPPPPVCQHNLLSKQTVPGHSESLHETPPSPTICEESAVGFLCLVKKINCSYIMFSDAKRLNWGKNRNLKCQLFLQKSEASHISFRNVCNNHYILVLKF